MQLSVNSSDRIATSSSLRIFERLFLACFCAGYSGADASAGLPQPASFTEEAVERGIQYVVQAAPSFGCGVSFADLDGDDDADIILVGGPDGIPGVFENDGSGHFIDRSQSTGIPGTFAPSGVVAGDYDADGDLDLYFSSYLGANLLARNDGGFAFADVTSIADVGDEGAGTGCAWADFDSDGWLDLYVANRTGTFGNKGPNRLYRNQGDGTFEDVALVQGVDDDRLTFQAVFFDMDRDADPDLYLSTDKGYLVGLGNRLFENVAGNFLEISSNSAADIAIDSMGIAVGDFDGNGLFDLYATNTEPGNPLLMNLGNGLFQESSAAAGTLSERFGWGTLFLDFDNDARLDLLVCNQAGRNRLYVCTQGWPCQDIATQVGLATSGDWFSVAKADVDNDGDVDLLMGEYPDRRYLYINQEGQNRNWVKLKIVGQGNNRFAIGAVAEVRVGENRWIDEVSAGGSYKAQHELILHFGMNDAQSIDEISVVWPGGTARTLTDYGTRQTWTVYPPESLGDADSDGSLTMTDADQLSLCITGPAIGLLQPGCEMMDFDGDASITLADYAQFQQQLPGSS